MEFINNYFLENKDFYLSLTKKISKNINGRQCHHRVSIIHILSKLYNLKTYLEIGVHNGTSMSYFVSSENAEKSYGIDLFEGTINKYKRDKLLLDKSYKNITNNNLKCEINLIKGNSFNENIINKVKELNINFDLLFIDGDHTYKGIKKDFLNYNKFVKKNGYIILDDYEPNYPGILKFTDEYIKNNNEFKIIGVFENNELIIQKI